MAKEPVIYDRVSFAKGQTIIKEGEQQSQAYLIQSGSVAVFTKIGDRTVELAALGVGEIVGEMALISDGVRTASVTALEDCNLIKISRDDFKERLNNSDRAIRAVVSMLTKRVQESNESMASKITSLNNLEAAAAEVYEETKSEVPDIDDERLLPKLKALLHAIEEFKSRFVMESLGKGYTSKDK